MSLINGGHQLLLSERKTQDESEEGGKLSIEKQYLLMRINWR